MDVGVLELFLKFSADDLAANRDAGRLSSPQSSRLLWSGAWRLLIGPPLLVGGLAVAFVVDTSLFAVMALFAAGAGLYMTWRGFAFVVDSRNAEVAYVTAPLRLRQVHSRYGTSYWADVGPVSKRISLGAYNAMADGMALHLYYAPGCRSLLSVEPATEGEHRPLHPFGPDSAHTWDRLRWSWVLITIGALGIAIGIHQVAVAHPAQPVAVEGVMTNYVETHGKSTTRTIYMDNGQSYTPKNEYAYDPPAPAWDSLIGQNVTLYVNDGTADVLAVNVAGQVYAADWYEHPEHQTSFEITNGAITLAASSLFLAFGVALIVRDRRRSETAAGADENVRPARYTPPTVRTTGMFVSGTLGVLIALGATVGFIVVAFASAK